MTFKARAIKCARAFGKNLLGVLGGIVAGCLLLGVFVAAEYVRSNYGVGYGIGVAVVGLPLVIAAIATIFDGKCWRD